MNRASLFFLLPFTFTLACGDGLSSVDHGDESALEAPTEFDATKTRFSARDVVDLTRYQVDDAALRGFRAEVDTLHASGTLSQDYLGFATVVGRKIDDVDGESEFGPLEASSPFRTRITHEERVAIYLYTTDELYQRLNDALRNASNACRAAHPAPCPESAYATLAPVANTAKVLASALNKLPQVSGKLFRGTRHLGAYQKGAVVTEPAFVSAASGDVPEAFRVEGVLEFDAKRCASVAMISAAGAMEREAICPPGTSFRVKDRLEEDGAVTVVAEQI